MPILGTSGENIDRAEDRRKFSALLDDLRIDQPRWAHLVNVVGAEKLVASLGGFPINEHIEDAGVHTGDVEMSSTGEVGCFGDDLHEALLHALVATGFRFPTRGVLMSLGPLQDKYWFADEARVISEELKLAIYATPGTANALDGLGIPATRLAKHDGPGSGIRAIDEGMIDLVINVPVEYDELGRPDGYMIRRGAVDAGIPLITDLQLARAVVEALRHRKMSDLETRPYDEFLARVRLEI